MMNHSSKETSIESLRQADLSPVATPTHLATAIEILVERVSEHFKDWTENQTGGIKMEWANMSQLAKIFGVSRRSMERMMQEILRKHDIRVIQSSDYIGKKGHRRYRIEDVERALEEKEVA